MRSVALFLAITAFACAQTPFLAPNGKQALSGRLGSELPPNAQAQPTSFDCAADGTVVNSITGEPIARARVNLTGVGASTSSGIADASGAWRLANVACGPAQALARRPGFLPGSRSLTLLSGAAVHDVRLELIPQSVIFGKVLDEQGDPVMGAQITLLTSRVVEGKRKWVNAPAGAASSNDLGEYRVAGLGRGKYLACAHMPQQNQLFLGPQGGQTVTGVSCYPGPPDGGTADAIDVPAGREMKVDFVLNQVPAVHVRGTISGVPDRRRLGINLGGRGAMAGIRGNTGGNVRDGVFEFRVAAGSYVLTADYFEAGKRLLARFPIEVGSSDIDNLVVNLDGGFTVTGSVRFESQAGRKTPQAGVNLRPSEPYNGTAQLKWDAEHTSFTFSDVVPGAYLLDVSVPGPYWVKSATLAGQDLLNGEFSLSQAAGPIAIVVRDNGGAVEGDVVDADGKSATGTVMALRNGKVTMVPSSGGHFKFQNLAPGDYTVYAWDDAGLVEYADSEWMRRYAGSGVAVTVTEGQSSPVKLTRQIPPQ